MRAIALSTVLTALVGLAVSTEAQTPAPSIITRVRVDPKRPIDFHAVVSPESLYVGQQATYQVAVFLDEEARMRLRRNPEFLPPELRGLLSYELGVPTRLPPHDVSGKRYEAHVFQRALFPLASGPITIPSAQLTYALPQSASYFSREESYVVRAESANLVVRPLPEVGRPPDFTGAVGVLKSSARFDAATARVGDPLVLTLRIFGTGNVKLLPRPTLEVEWASSVPGTERLQVDTSGPLVRGAKEFDWILTPARAGDVVTPVIRYSYFNPYVGRYEVAETPPVALTVRTGALAASTDEEEPQSLMALRTQDRGVVAPLVTEHSLFWLFIVTLPLPALLLLRQRSPRERRHTSPLDALQLIARRLEREEGARDVHAKISASVASTVGATRRAFVAALAARLGANPDLLTERLRVERTLLRRGVTRECTTSVLELLERLDLAAFSATSAFGERTAERRESAALARDAIDLFQQVDAEALHASIAPLPELRNAMSTGNLLLLLSAGIGMGTLSATAHARTLQAQDTSVSNPRQRSGPEDTMARGTTTPGRAGRQGVFVGDPFASAANAYSRRQFREAADLFHDQVVRSPRDADALANWGTAAWAAGDTVGAVIAWQRAARLEPMADDMQQRLALLPAGARSGIAEVPLIPVNWLAVSGAALWACGWSTLGWLGWMKRRKRMASPSVTVCATVTLIASIACGTVAVWGALALRNDNLAVVIRPETMRAAADGESDAIGGAATGDVVRVDHRDPLWSLVRHADGRVGWLPARRLIALTDDRPLR